MSLAKFISTPKLAEYKERFKDHYKLQRRADGVILVEAHTAGGPIQLSVENHRSVGQLFKTIGADPENEIMIFTGSGKEFMMDADPEGFALEQEDLRHWAYEYAYKDGRINVSSLINDLEIPTIGALNGPGFHSEICLMCDLTICTEDTIIYDLHYDIGSVPGDGIHSCFQELLGVKRAAYALLTGQAIDARTALEYGMVNEVVPREKLLDRAWQLAESRGVDSLGHFLPPFFYAGGQFIEAAVKAVGALDEAKLAQWLHNNTIDTIVGPVKFGPDGNWVESRIVWAQYRDAKDKDLDQFRHPGKQIVLHPEALATGKIVAPYKKARA